MVRKVEPPLPYALPPRLMSDRFTFDRITAVAFGVAIQYRGGGLGLEGKLRGLRGCREWADCEA
jgi:hypothetical protein